MQKQTKLRSEYRKCKSCGGTGAATATAAVTAAAYKNDAQVSPKPKYRPIADPNAADPFVEDPFSGFAPLRWREALDRQPYADPASVRERELEGRECEHTAGEAFIYNAGYLGQGHDYRIWFAQDDSMSHAVQGRCGQCDGAGVVRVEWTARLSLSPAIILLGVACCAAAYTERPWLTASVYATVMLAARIVRFKSERYFVAGQELYAAKRKTGVQPVRHECQCELADSYTV